jgi:hypothetical protein
MLTPEKHLLLLNKKATSKQIHLYNKFPEYRGFSDLTLDTDIIEAVLILALTCGGPTDRVFVFTPISNIEWVISQFDQISKVMFKECKRLDDPKKMAQSYMVLFKKVVVLGKLLQLEKEPEHWVSFGFTIDNPIPSWLKQKLIIE